MRIITWVDPQGRYRVTSPAYDSLERLHGHDEDQAIEWTWNKVVAAGGYGITTDHPYKLVEDADQRVKLAECCGTYFRYAGLPDSEGRRSAVGGAWEMDTDGRPKVNMPKARLVHMDHIRKARNTELAKLDLTFMRAIEDGDGAEQTRIAAQKQVLRDIPQTFSLSTYKTPGNLKAAWPSELPVRE